VTLNNTFVIGGPGQYSLMKRNNGKKTAQTAARPYEFPWPVPVDIYLIILSATHTTEIQKKKNHHIMVPAMQPKRVLRILLTSPNVVSP
jgi:hypothetical protein